jgi:hypothetical protein
MILPFFVFGQTGAIAGLQKQLFAEMEGTSE